MIAASRLVSQVQQQVLYVFLGLLDVVEGEDVVLIEVELVVDVF